MKTKTALNLTLIFLPFAGVLLAVIFWFYISFGSQIGAIYVSPANPANKVSFIWNSFRNSSSLLLFANPRHQRGRLVAELIFENRYAFSNAQWTKDGQVIVCSMLDDQNKDQTVLGIAYDFSNDKILAPAYNGTEFNKIEPDIKKLVMAHGGLGGSQIWSNQITNRLWPWQVPSGEHFP
jgi:hypothetical protein